jgi:steroid 5-alpha reductase family enzyme
MLRVREGTTDMAGQTDFAPIVIAYLLAIATGIAALFALPVPQPWDAFAADVIATLVIFGFSLRYRNSSFYDPYWSVIPPLLAVYWMWSHPGIPNSPRTMLVMALVWLWALRLTANWTVHWGGLQHEDWRYPIVRARAGKAAVWADLFGIHLFPTVQVFLGCLPVYAVMNRGDVPLGWLDALAFVVTLGAIMIETVADLQLHAFIAKRSPGAFIDTGLWAWSRHPNYFGELSFWWGLMLFGLAAAPTQWWWIVPGALAMTAMFVFASIPFMDKRSLERRPAYCEHMRKVSALVPLPPRRFR